MYVQIKLVDGSRSGKINELSRLTSILKLKEKVEKEFDVPIENQRLFYKGKQLEDEYKLFDYSVKLNDVIQLMIKVKQNEEIVSKENKENVNHSNSKTKSEEKETQDNDEDTTTSETPQTETQDENYINAESKYYELGDYVDAMHDTYGGWFEAQIVKITVDKDKADDFEESDLIFTVFYLIFQEQGEEGLKFDDIRPLPREEVDKIDETLLGVRIMGNYNRESPNEIGYWHDMIMESPPSKRSTRQPSFKATLYFGRKSAEAEIFNCTIKPKMKFYKIENPILLIERSDEYKLFMKRIPELRKVVPDCSECKDEGDECGECGCQVCHSKLGGESMLICEECQMYFHMKCLTPPLDSVPEDDWYCAGCKRDTSEVVLAGQKLKESKKKSKLPSSNKESTRDWGKGMACVGFSKHCTIVGKDHFGPIPGIEVGQSYKFRVQLSESGIHRPPVAGIHGKEDIGAFSIVLSGGYEDDLDNGEEFLYTGSGGRDLSGNKRTSAQSFDQTLTRMNRALAKNCNAPIDDTDGNEAKYWREGKPIRVVRNYKASKHSKYAPTEGNRYDGIYKVVKYYPKKGRSNFLVWQYHLRRDDESPAPWTKEGKQRIKDLGLKMIFPEGYEEDTTQPKLNLKRKADDDDKDGQKEQKVSKKIGYKFPEQVVELIKQSEKFKTIWEKAEELCKESQKQVLDFIEETFSCIICQELVHIPITTDCDHSMCFTCLKRSFDVDVSTCPYCRNQLDKSILQTHKNENLQNILMILFPGYGKNR